jgi:hypothetical protein
LLITLYINKCSQNNGRLAFRNLLQKSLTILKCRKRDKDEEIIKAKIAQRRKALGERAKGRLTGQWNMKSEGKKPSSDSWHVAF